MSESGRLTMRMVHQKMLIKEYGIVDGQELDGNQELVASQCLGLVPDNRMTSEPL